MSWADIRREARLNAHKAFGRAAVYTPPGVGAQPLEVTVRHHTNKKRFGDLDREGYAEVIEDINRIIFLRDEVPLPVRNSRVELSGRTYRIEIVDPTDDDDTVVGCDVVRVA